MKWAERAVLGWVLVATAGTQLRDSLNTNDQGLELLPDDALRRFYQEPRTAVLLEFEDVKTHTVPPFEGPQRADRGSETVCG